MANHIFSSKLFLNSPFSIANSCINYIRLPEPSQADVIGFALQSTAWPRFLPGFWLWLWQWIGATVSSWPCRNTQSPCCHGPFIRPLSHFSCPLWRWVSGWWFLVYVLFNPKDGIIIRNDLPFSRGGSSHFKGVAQPRTRFALYGEAAWKMGKEREDMPGSANNDDAQLK